MEEQRNEFKELKQLVDEYKIKVNDLEELIIQIKKKSMTNELFRQLFSIQTSDELIIELSNICYTQIKLNVIQN